MAKKIGLLLVVCLLAPAAARADDGGFWDMFWNWDLKLQGVGTEFHVLCLDGAGKRIGDCEERFRNITKNPFDPGSYGKSLHSFQSFEGIKHEINFRVSVLWSYGDRFDSAKLAPGDGFGSDARIIGFNLLGMYNYRINKRFDAGAGGGVIPLFRLANNVSRPTVTAAFLWNFAGPWYARIAGNYYWNTLTAADLGHPTAAVSLGPEFGSTFTVGYDLRRVGQFNVAR